MTCKDCIHSGLCYKENDYDNFPDRCGDFISNKILEERPRGTWEYGGFCFSVTSYKCPFCKSKTLERTKFCSECGADMRGDKE